MTAWPYSHAAPVHAGLFYFRPSATPDLVVTFMFACCVRVSNRCVLRLLANQWMLAFSLRLDQETNLEGFVSCNCWMNRVCVRNRDCCSLSWCGWVSGQQCYFSGQEQLKRLILCLHDFMSLWITSFINSLFCSVCVFKQTKIITVLCSKIVSIPFFSFFITFVTALSVHTGTALFIYFHMKQLLSLSFQRYSVNINFPHPLKRIPPFTHHILPCCLKKI